MSKTNLVFLLLVVVSALGLVTLRYQTAQLFSARERAEKHHSTLESEYRRLQSAQSKLISHEIIKTTAVQQRMQLAPLNRTEIVRVP